MAVHAYLSGVIENVCYESFSNNAAQVKEPNFFVVNVVCST